MLGKSIMNHQLVKKYSDKIKKKIIKEAKKKIRRREVFDSYTFSTYLHTIDGKYTSLRATVDGLTSLVDYPRIRRDRVSQTSQLIEFYAQDEHELQTLASIVNAKARDAGRLDDLRHEKRVTVVNKDKLSWEFEQVADEYEVQRKRNVQAALHATNSKESK